MMKRSKKLICGLVATAIIMGGSLTAGCITTDNEKDMRQRIAEVNISDNEEFKKLFGDYSSAVATKEFIKRDMISAYVNGYYQLAQSGYNNSAIFSAIKDALVSDAVVTQYATVYLLKHKVEEVAEADRLSLDVFKSKATEKEKYEYLVGEEGVKKATYNLYSSLNSVLDGNEKTVIADKNKSEGKDEYVGTSTRTAPSGVDTVKEDYVPENYTIYTGYTGYLLEEAEKGGYEPLDGTDMMTRRKAYASLVSSLKSNYLITAEDVETTDILKLSYVQNTYISQLQQVIVEQFNDAYEEEQIKKINTVGEDGVLTYVQAKYDDKQDGELTAQKKTNSTASAFESAMDTISDTSFILWSPSTVNDTDQAIVEGKSTYGTFGYVYNILLPFSTQQNVELKALQSLRDSDVIDESGYFYARNKLLKNIATTDQREAWFNGTTDYSFNAKETELAYYGKGDGRDYLFFENNLTKKDKYEDLDKYIGLYSYNGAVTENEDGSYKLVPKKLDIDDMLFEFSAYINYVLDPTGSKNFVTMHAGDSMTGIITNYGAYYDVENFKKSSDDDTEIDYGKLVYATGKVEFDADNLKSENMFVKEGDLSNRYKAMAAVNELQYAYTTDTGVLSQYIGYSVTAYETSFIKEFEYAAQQALRMGPGAFKVCAGDYGWHLIYVTETFDFNGEEVYKDVKFTQARVDIEGSFENRFYNWYKDSVISSQTSLKRAEILKDFNTDDAVKVYEKAYKDLLKL